MMPVFGFHGQNDKKGLIFKMAYFFFHFEFDFMIVVGCLIMESFYYLGIIFFFILVLLIDNRWLRWTSSTRHECLK